RRSRLCGSVVGVVSVIAAVAVVLLSLAAAIVCLGTRARPPSGRPTVDLKERARKFHRRAGVWMIIFAAVWGVTGTIFAFPWLVQSLVGTGSSGQAIFEGLYVVHSGSAGGWPTKAIWATSGVLPSLLALTGVMGWRRRAPKPLVDV